MQNPSFYIDGYLLKILESAYLVEVEAANGRTGRYAQPANLPQWIFRSPHAIWLMQGEATLIQRAIRGEEVKQQIMNRYVQLAAKNHSVRKTANSATY